MRKEAVVPERVNTGFDELILKQLLDQMLAELKRIRIAVERQNKEWINTDEVDDN